MMLELRGQGAPHSQVTCWNNTVERKNWCNVGTGREDGCGS